MRVNKEGKTVKKVFQKILFLLLFFIGLLIFLYPFISDGLNDYLDQKIVQIHQKKASEKTKEQLEQAKKEMQIRNEQIEKENNPGAAVDPFAEEQQEVEEAGQGTLSYFESHTIGVITIPEIDVRLPIFDHTNELLLAKGASLLEGTSNIFGGINTHAVISAHRGLREAKLFTDIPDLTNGDVFYIEVLDEIHAYEVDQIKVIEPTEISDLRISEGEDYVTLMTCTPYSINSHRLLVRGHRIPYVEEMKEEIQMSTENKEHKFAFLVIGLVFLIIIFLIFLYRVIRK